MRQESNFIFFTNFILFPQYNLKIVNPILYLCLSIYNDDFFCMYYRTFFMVFCYHNLFGTDALLHSAYRWAWRWKRCLAVLLKYLNSLLVLVVLAFGLCLFSLGDSRVVSGYWLFSWNLHTRVIFSTHLSVDKIFDGKYFIINFFNPFSL